MKHKFLVCFWIGRHEDSMVVYAETADQAIEMTRKEMTGFRIRVVDVKAL